MNGDWTGVVILAAVVLATMLLVLRRWRRRDSGWQSQSEDVALTAEVDGRDRAAGQR